VLADLRDLGPAPAEAAALTRDEDGQPGMWRLLRAQALAALLAAQQAPREPLRLGGRSPQAVIQRHPLEREAALRPLHDPEIEAERGDHPDRHPVRQHTRAPHVVDLQRARQVRECQCWTDGVRGRGRAAQDGEGGKYVSGRRLVRLRGRRRPQMPYARVVALADDLRGLVERVDPDLGVRPGRLGLRDHEVRVSDARAGDDACPDQHRHDA
jgi:hypothetical protein